MPCVLADLVGCWCRPTDRKWFVRGHAPRGPHVWTVDEGPLMLISTHPLGLGSTVLEAADAHAALGALSVSWEATGPARGPSRVRMLGAVPRVPLQLLWAQGIRSREIRYRQLPPSVCPLSSVRRQDVWPKHSLLC